MAKYEFTDAAYVPSREDVLAYMKVGEYCGNQAIDRLVEEAPDEFATESDAREFVFLTTCHYLDKILDDYREACEHHLPAATSALHATLLAFGFSAVVHELPVARELLS